MFARRLLVVLALTAALPAPTAEAVPLAEEAVVGANRPVVWLFPNESNKPMPASPFIAQSALKYHGTEMCTPQKYPGEGQVDEKKLAAGSYRHYGFFPKCDDRSTWASTADKNAPFSLDLADRAHGGDLPHAPMYYEFVPARAITFWFLYGYNSTVFFDAKGHEGDWERVSFILDSQNRATSVVFFQHGYACKTPPEALERDSGQPVVYSAHGTHASYPHPGSKDIKGVPGVSDHAARGTLWKPPPIPVQDQQWYGYAGRWGASDDSPDGPSPHRPGAPDSLAGMDDC